MFSERASIHRRRASTVLQTRSSIAVVPSRGVAPVDLHIELGELLGEGTSGKAFRIDNEHDGHTYCLKVVPVAAGADMERACAKNEAQIHSSLNHAGIVRYCYAWSVPTKDAGLTCYTMMELCEQDLWSRLEAASAEATPIPPSTRMRWACQLAGALAHIHAAGVLHRDLVSTRG